MQPYKQNPTDPIIIIDIARYSTIPSGFQLKTNFKLKNS